MPIKEIHLLCNCMLAIDVHTNAHVPKTIDQRHTGKTSPPTECESTKEIGLSYKQIVNLFAHILLSENT